MSWEGATETTEVRITRPLRARDPEAEHRPATPLELFFDLVFVVAVAFAADQLHEGLVRGEVWGSLPRYVIAFFGLWWAWVNFTWFASAYDSDDVAYRIFVFVTMTGALILAAGIPQFFDNFNRGLAVLGYVVMRLALVTQWIRVARADTPRRSTALRYALGVSVCQLVWVAALVFPALWWPALFVFGPTELLVPLWAESASATTWHPGHIVERYGLFMIIVLGESVLAASLAIQSATNSSELSGELLQVIIGGLLIVYSLWWIYFDRPKERSLSSSRAALVWGYIHLPIFASVAAVGAGLSVAIDGTAGDSLLGPTATGLTIAIPVAVYLMGLSGLYVRAGISRWQWLGVTATALLVMSAAVTSAPVLVIGLLLVIFIAIKVAMQIRGDPNST
ncbi:MAG TPA: low temperature requirement protein A [Actinomycetota bacterium]|nr:low temperature requirement protein A [Actinomycetota bacterium]